MSNAATHRSPSSAASLGTSIVGTALTLSLGCGAAYLYSTKQNFMCSSSSKNEEGETSKIFCDERVGSKVKKVIAGHIDRFTSKESLIKIVRQLDFWYSEGLPEAELIVMAEKLSEKATAIMDNEFVCPKVRFGKTELQVPIVTCGGMRLQQTWMPDFMWPLAPRKSKVLNSPSQENLMNAIRTCLKKGINHFETARMYGTSEYQFAEALYQLMQNGEIKREDFIFQTKISPTKDRKLFEKKFEQSWAHCEKLGYIDLFSIWCVSSKEQCEWALADGEDSCMAAALEYQRQGKVKHIGFSTHGSTGRIMELINSERFEYVNLHAHFLGSYHGEGTPDGQGGHGNRAAVKRALELDMGVFQISPLDKGGKMYCPSKTLARTIGPQMTPIEFSLLSTWKSIGCHTASVGFSRPIDVEDAINAAKMFAEDTYEEELTAVEARLDLRMVEELGEEWTQKGLLNLPTCEDESSHGTAIGHMLWLYNLMKAFGMYDFCLDRYKNLEKQKWNVNKSFDENRKNMTPGNLGRRYVPSFDYSEALKDHFSPKSAVANMEQATRWLQIDKDNVSMREAAGFDVAYDMRVWNCFPGDPNPKGIILQNVTFGLAGCHGGPTKSAADLAAKLAEEVKKC